MNSMQVVIVSRRKKMRPLLNLWKAAVIALGLWLGWKYGRAFGEWAGDPPDEANLTGGMLIVFGVGILLVPPFEVGWRYTLRYWALIAWLVAFDWLTADAVTAWSGIAWAEVPLVIRVFLAFLFFGQIARKVFGIAFRPEDDRETGAVRVTGAALAETPRRQVHVLTGRRSR